MVIICDSNCFFSFQAVFKIKKPSERATSIPSIYIGLVYGDGTSFLYVKSNQSFYCEYQKATNKRSNPKVNFYVEEHGDLVSVNDLRISGSKIPALDLRGTLRGVTKLTLSSSKVFQVGPTGSVVVGIHRENSSSVAINLGMLTLEYNAKLQFAEIGEMDIGYLTMRQKTRVSAKYVSIKSTSIDIEGEGIISTTARFNGLGRGSGNNSGDTGSGGGHGGYGGGFNNTGGGNPYGSYSQPSHPGSKGGGTGGGNGGNLIKASLLYFLYSLECIF